jgi:NAD(P)-dependent dehydrogenase (short-subunit alcohol dehydrogenase family)
MTKGGLLSLTRTWALEFAADGITANAIGPGPVDTETFRLNNAPATIAGVLEAIPMKRLAVADDVAQAVSFFLDARSGYITGQMLHHRLADDYLVVNLDKTEPANDSRAEFVQVDLADLAATRTCLAELCARHRFTRLVNNVGMSSAVPAAQVDDELMEKSISLSVNWPVIRIRFVDLRMLPSNT